jgi:predicted transcriptional regulator
MALATAVTTGNIRERREQLDISRLNLAVKAGVSSTWLAEIEAGRQPRGEALTSVLAALDEVARIVVELR